MSHTISLTPLVSLALTTPPSFDFSGGQHALDFANTVGGHRMLEPREYLHGYADLLGWAWAAGMLDLPTVAALQRRAETEPAAAEAVFARTVALRESLFSLFTAVAAEEPPAAEILAAVSREVAWAYANAQLVPDADGFGWRWAGPPEALDLPLWGIARAAADLLTGPELRSVRECAQTDCTWLFLDTSKNRSRRWCDMRTCGNRAKARRHHARVRGQP